MRRRVQGSFRLLHACAGALFVAAGSAGLFAAACSAGGGTGGEESFDPLAPPPGDALPGERESSGFMVGDDAIGLDAEGNPLNIGSEVACDGIDENGNGIIDDVDKGRDGLCDCLRIGFLGELASDAGNQTGAFENWLEERSDFPVTHIASTDRLTAQSFDGLQVVVVGNLARRAGAGGYSPDEVTAFSEWIRSSGGGAISLAGYTARETDVEPTVQLLAPTGLGYDYRGRGPGVFGTGAPPVLVRGITAPDHPTMEGIFVMGVYAAYPVVGDGQVIVTEQNLALAMAKEFGEGRVFAFADEWITQDALWVPMANQPLTPCQQACNQCSMQCVQCDRQCSDCELQPCEGGQAPPAGGTCRRGCDQACEACSANCTTCETQCETCAAAERMDRLDVPRFWLNTIRWLTPENECKVPLPPPTVY